MVKKSKRKQIVVPFERGAAAAVVNVARFQNIVSTISTNSDDIETVMKTVVLLSECGNLTSQAKVLQERKGVFKVLLVNALCVAL